MHALGYESIVENIEWSIGAFKGKGKGKRKGKGQDPDVVWCSKCGKAGHKNTDCYSTQGKSKGKVQKGKGQGKLKGKGKGKASVKLEPPKFQVPELPAKRSRRSPGMLA